MSFVPKIGAGVARNNHAELCDALGIAPAMLDTAIERSLEQSDPFFGHVLAACAAVDSDVHVDQAIERARTMLANGDVDTVVRVAGIDRIADTVMHVSAGAFDRTQHPAYPYTSDAELAATQIFLVFRDRDLVSEPRRVLFGTLGEYLDRIALAGSSTDEVELVIYDISTNGRHIGCGLVGTTLEIVGLPRPFELTVVPNFFLQPA